MCCHRACHQLWWVNHLINYDLKINCFARVLKVPKIGLLTAFPLHDLYIFVLLKFTIFHLKILYKQFRTEILRFRSFAIYFKWICFSLSSLHHLILIFSEFPIFCDLPSVKYWLPNFAVGGLRFDWSLMRSCAPSNQKRNGPEGQNRSNLHDICRFNNVTLIINTK